MNVREDGKLRVSAFDGAVWTFMASGDGGWTGGEGLTPTARDAHLSGDCSSSRLKLTPGSAREITLQRVQLREAPIRFQSNGIDLTGRLVEPNGLEKFPLVVLLHGSEKRSALTSNPLQYLLPARGIGVLVFDKRGTGSSGGEYTQDFEQLSSDGAAAFEAAAKAAGGRAASLGFFGGSEGAWIGPLAAKKAATGGRVGFVVAGYGLAQSPLEEDTEEVLDDLRRAGFDDESILSKGREISGAAGVVMASNFERGFEELDAIKRKYRSEPWYSKIEGDFSGDFLEMPSWLLRVVGPWLDTGTTWSYEPLPVLRETPADMLWVLAGRDSEAPSGTTLKLLLELQKDRPTLDIALFPDAEHGILRFKIVDGKPVGLGPSPNYYPLLAGWIRDRTMKEGPDVQLFRAPAPTQK